MGQINEGICGAHKSGHNVKWLDMDIISQLLHPITLLILRNVKLVNYMDQFKGCHMRNCMLLLNLGHLEVRRWALLARFTLHLPRGILLL